jgi:hypothetical protein
MRSKDERPGKIGWSGGLQQRRRIEWGVVFTTDVAGGEDVATVDG